MTSRVQGKFWVFVKNNPTISPQAYLTQLGKLPNFQYASFSEEKVATTHYQGYIEFNKLKDLNWVIKNLPGCHIERRKGTQQEADDYTKKMDGSHVSGPYVAGTLTPNEQGKRNDVAAAVALLQEGGIRAVAEQMPEAYVKFHRGLNALALVNKPVKRVPEVHLCFGPTATGKTRRFHSLAPDNDKWANPLTDGFWLDGYFGQSWCLIDDFAGGLSKWSLTNVLRILDRYDVQVPVKGGFAWFNPSVIYVTTNIHPLVWYDYARRLAQYAALKRRFHWVHWWKSDERNRVPVSIPNPDLELSADVLSDGDGGDDWDHFWRGPLSANVNDEPPFDW